MRKPRLETLILLLFAAVVLLLIANLVLFLRMNRLQERIARSAEAWPSALAVGSQAPEFSLIDTRGRSVSLKDYAGQRLLIAFVHPSCPICKDMFPELKRFESEHPDQAIVMLSGGSEEENRELDQTHGFGFPILNADERVFEAYEVPGVPWFFVLDDRGVVVAEGTASTMDRIESLLAHGTQYR